ncbi:response regulator transcription factor [Olivibacter sitiensis]|uniref:response regulator transcription factor n=1 Tax=Olivibacter sitiensis TaxID=376470 RepID=UPI0004058683|nr:response regulator transcription factor [Olivibacter sitiensis]
MARILLVEDDERVASFIQKGLEEHTHSVLHVGKGYEAIGTTAIHTFDAIILDIMLPDIDGIKVCQLLRQNEQTIPILMLSALDSTGNKVMGLEAGADDYLAKPFHFEELLARIQALLRRVAFQRGISDMYRYADLELDRSELAATRHGKRLTLSPREFKLLAFLMENREKTLSRVQIAEAVWDMHFDSGTNVVDVYINYLRNKIDKGFAFPLIHTVKGRGYLFKDKSHELES